MDNDNTSASAFPAWAVLLLVLFALAGAALAAGGGDPVGYARAAEARAAADVDIARIMADLTRDIETMRAENERLHQVLEYQARADDRADRRQFLFFVQMLAVMLASGAGVVLLLTVGAGTTKPKERKK